MCIRDRHNRSHVFMAWYVISITIVGSMEQRNSTLNIRTMSWIFHRQVTRLGEQPLFSQRQISSSTIHFTRRCSFTWRKEPTPSHWKNLLSCSRNHCLILKVLLSMAFHSDQLTSRRCHGMAHHWFGLHEVTWNCMEQQLILSLIHISEPTRLLSISYAVF